jgi:uncharacterized protein involved in outer membrane biogenesis
VQTTLLAVGIAIIVALVAALAGPFVINWNDYRGVFEARASQAMGVPVRVGGRIDARLLPTPSVTLRNVEARGPSGEVRLKVREVGIELALGPLVRGEWRATEVRFASPELHLGLDENGHLDWAASRTADPDGLSIDHLSIDDGRVILTDANSQSRQVLERFWFNGDARSMAGPVKGEGGFVAGDERHSYRVTSGRAGDDGVKLRLAIDAAERPMTFDADGTLRFEKGAPQFEGGLTLTRLPGVVMSRGRAINSEPWRLSGHVKATNTGALFEQIDLQYGAEERALKFGGAADLKFGERPRLEAVLSARQLDLDRLVALPEATRRLPLVAIRAAAEALGDAIQPGMPVRLGVGIDSVTIGGAAVQSVRGDLTADAAGWEFETLEFRAPGFAQVRASGRFAWKAEGASFSGPASIAATDPKVLMAWIEGRPLLNAAGAIGPLRASGDLTFAPDRISVERLKADIDRKTIAGRLAYVWGGARPKLDAEINAADLDLDAAFAFVHSALPDARLDWPGEVALALDLGRATMGGLEARNAKAKLKLDESGLVFERLAIADLAGAGIDLRGRIDDPWKAPKGALNFDLTGARLDGVVALLEKVSPQAAEAIRPLSSQLVPAKLRVTLNVDRAAPSADAQPANGQAGSAAFRVTGTAGALRVGLNGSLAGDLASWRSAALKAEGRLDADDGRALARLFGLDRVVTLANGAGFVQLTAAGSLDGDTRVQTRFAANGLDASANVVVKSGDGGISGQGDVALAAVDVTPLRQPTGRVGQPTPLAFKARLGFTPDRVSFEDLAGTVAATAFNGRLAFALGTPLRVEGRLDADAFNAAALLGALMGMPNVDVARTAANAQLWPAQPFAARFLSDVQGRIELRASRAAVAPALDIRQFEATLRIADNETAIDDIKGVMANGRFVANLTLPRSAEGRALEARMALSGADIAALMPGDTRSPVNGRITLNLDLKGGGRTPASLVGALGGAGTLSVESVELTGLDPRVFEAVTRATDQGASVDTAKIKAVVESALENGSLRVPRADGTLSVTAGQLRLGSLLAKGGRADLSVNGTVDLAPWLMDARLALIGPSGPDGPAAGRPEIFIALKGLPTAPRRSIDVSGLVGWLTLRSVELQARRLEAIEAARGQEPPPATPANPAVQRGVPAATSVPVSTPPAATSASVPPAATSTPVFPPVMAPEATSSVPPPAPTVVPRETAQSSAEPQTITEMPVPAAVSQQSAVPERHAVPEATASRAVPLPRLRRLSPRTSARSPIASGDDGSTAQPRAVAPASPRPSPVRRQAPAAEQAPTLPPPVDIRPAPAPRRAGTPQGHQRPNPGADARLRPPANIPDRRSNRFFDLFGAAR